MLKSPVTGFPKACGPTSFYQCTQGRRKHLCYLRALNFLTCLQNNNLRNLTFSRHVLKAELEVLEIGTVIQINKHGLLRKEHTCVCVCARARVVFFFLFFFSDSRSRHFDLHCLQENSSWSLRGVGNTDTPALSLPSDRSADRGHSYNWHSILRISCIRTDCLKILQL
jgi:hypothetical protein